MPVLFALGLLASVGGAACRQDMHDQPKVKAYREADFFADRRGTRPLPEGTVARGFLQRRRSDVHREGERPVRRRVPVPGDARRCSSAGSERFNIYCSPCHGRLGLGNGMIVQRGLSPPPSFHDEKIRNQPVGYCFDVMTNGFGAMHDYKAQVDA